MKIKAFLIPVATINRIDVRQRAICPKWIPKYVCFSPENLSLEEFRTKKDAINWARKTLDWVQA